MPFSMFDLPWWGYVAVTLGLTHVTIAAVTIYLHRHQAHHALELHPAVAHFFRFWLWLTTGMQTRAWTAIHRKHHAKCETADDPHSPVTRGIRKVLWEGAELYRAESGNVETLEKYGHGTPDDWIERKLYSRHATLGIAAMLVLDAVLFGAIGLTIWAVQMAWIPLFAAGVINGIGHHWGYRTFSSNDASRNIVPWGILIGGEELHNNHHAHAGSARLSNKWYEIDVGWLYIRGLERLRLAQVKRVAPRLRLDTGKRHCDAETVRAILTHRQEVMARLSRTLRETCSAEAKRARRAKPDEWETLRAARRWLARHADTLAMEEHGAVRRALAENATLRTVYEMGRDLSALWERSSVTQEQALSKLEAWCALAETSGIEALARFSHRLRCYAS